MSLALLLLAVLCLLVARRLWDRQRMLALVGLVLVLASSFGMVAVTVRPASAAQLSDTDLAKILASGGFKGPALVTGLEIVFAESGGRTDARNQNTNGTVDRGIWQINSVHASVTDGCADDPVCATKYAFELSKQGADWHDWVTYNTGAAQHFSARAHKAVSDAGGSVSTADAIPLAADSSGLPSLPMPPVLDPKGYVLAAITGLLMAWDQSLLATFEKLWNGMVVGEDELSGSVKAGQFLVLDNSRLHDIWAWVFGLMLSSDILVCALSIFSLLYMFRGGASHELKRAGLDFVVSMILMAGSWFLITQLIAVDNAFVNTINGHVAMELHNLPSYQNLSPKDPGQGATAQALADAGTLGLMVLILGVLMILLMILIAVRLVIIWVLVAISPIVAGLYWIFPGVGRYYARVLSGWVFLKAGIAIVFMVFMLMGIYSPFAIVNAGLMIALVVAMFLIPGTILQALHAGVGGVGASAHLAAVSLTSSPIRLAAGGIWGQARGQSAAQARQAAQAAYYQAKAAQANASAARQNQLAEARARKANERAA